MGLIGKLLHFQSQKNLNSLSKYLSNFQFNIYFKGSFRLDLHDSIRLPFVQCPEVAEHQLLPLEDAHIGPQIRE